jgi:Zinc knuckle
MDSSDSEFDDFVRNIQQQFPETSSHTSSPSHSPAEPTAIAPEFTSSKTNNTLPKPATFIVDDNEAGGRYWMPDAKVCRFCRKEGHIFRDCTAKVMILIQATRCTLCSAEHDPLQCPLKDVCWTCYSRGHVKNVYSLNTGMPRPESGETLCVLRYILTQHYGLHNRMAQI